MGIESVQTIAFAIKDKDNIPPEFIRSEHERPAIAAAHGSVLEVPTIDFGDKDEDKLVELIASASKEWGLFQVVNHGIPIDVIANLQRVGKEFFELPQQEKEAIASRGGVEGHGTSVLQGINCERSWGDHLYHNIWPPSVIKYHFWPKNPPSYRKANEEYSVYLREVANKLLKYLSKGLGLGEDEIDEIVGGEELVYLLKINYYPPCPRPDLALGVVPHTDMCVLTILVPNEVPGLQVSRDGLWHDVKYIPNALAIQIGDQLEIMSNGKYKAALHRSTVSKDRARISWPVFVEPAPERALGPIPKLLSDENLSDENPAKFKTEKFTEYKYWKLKNILSNMTSK